MSRVRIAAASTVATVGALIVGLGGLVGATNYGSLTGNKTTGCAVSWGASTVLDTNLSNTDPVYPGLMTDPSGTPVDYSNGGYITEVRPEYGDPGMFELNHWYTNPASPTAGTAVYWRLPVATDALINGVVVTVTLPGPAGGFSFDGVSSNAMMTLWGEPYDNYTWSSVAGASATTTDGMTWTIDLGDLPAGTGHVVQFNGSVPVGTDLTVPVIATAELRGTYDVGTESCSSPTTTTPTTAPTSAPTTTAPTVAPTTGVPTPSAPTTTIDPSAVANSLAARAANTAPARAATPVRGRLAYAG